MPRPDDPIVCRVTERVRQFNGKFPHEEVILSRDAAVAHQRRGRVEILGPAQPEGPEWPEALEGPEQTEEE